MHYVSNKQIVRVQTRQLLLVHRCLNPVIQHYGLPADKVVDNKCCPNTPGELRWLSVHALFALAQHIFTLQYAIPVPSSPRLLPVPSTMQHMAVCCPVLPCSYLRVDKQEKVLRRRRAVPGRRHRG